MKAIHLLICIALVTSAMAQDIVPATSEDLLEFEKNLEETRRVKDQNRSQNNEKERFGDNISIEARKLKDMSQEEKKKFGQSEKRKKGAGKSEDMINRGSTYGAHGDARVSAPRYRSGQTDAGAGSTSGSGAGRGGNRGR